MTGSTGSERLGQRIKMKRHDRGLTQEELANRLDVTPQHISAIELDKRLPSLSFLARLAERLDVTTDYLITGKNSTASDVAAAIMADSSISDEAKKALIVMIKVSRQANSG